MKPLEQFTTNKGGKFGRYSICKECKRVNNTDRSHRFKGGRRECYAQRKYGISWSDRASLLESAGMRCQICDKPLIDGSRAHDGACLDHDHNTGIIRGVLCNHCNRGLGLFKDSLAFLETATSYLKTRK